MRRDHRTRRGPGRDGRRNKAIPRVEGLEGRLLLYATNGGAWQHPNLITYSFVPDGTTIFYGSAPSNLFQAFNARWSTAAWEGVFQEAAAIWEQVANVNLVQVADNGTTMGLGSYQQGDPGMGDIRISGLTSAALGTSLLAYTILPPPINGGSEAGDIIMNTSQPWKMNSDFDLLTVAIHEFGHALGMDHSTISTADMYAYYNGVKQTLTPDDVAGIDSIYGPRQPDWIAAESNNSTAARSFDVTPYLTSQGWLAAGGLDIQNSGTPEWYKVTAPASTNGSLVVTMQSTNISALSPFLEVENSAQQLVSYAYTFGGYTGGTVTVKIGGVTPGQLYYIGVGAAVGGPTGAGNYGLSLNFGSTTLGAFPLALTPTAVTADKGGGGSADTTVGHGHGDTDPGPDSLGGFDGDALTILGVGSGSPDDAGQADPAPHPPSPPSRSCSSPRPTWATTPAPRRPPARSGSPSRPRGKGRSAPRPEPCGRRATSPAAPSAFSRRPHGTELGFSRAERPRHAMRRDRPDGPPGRTPSRSIAP